MKVSSVLYSVLCGPCLCVYVCFGLCFCPGGTGRSRWEPEDRRRFQRQQLFAPKPLVKRKRALTIPLPPSANSESPPSANSESSPSASSESPQVSLDQLASGLFKLPLELREMIWKAVLGGGAKYHIFRKKYRLGHLRCKNPERMPCSVPQYLEHPEGDSCYANLDEDGIWKGHSHYRAKSQGDLLLPLLLTCRRIYSEAVSILYTLNTFAFADLDCLRYLAATTLPQRFQAIRSLEITWCFTWPIYDDLSQRLILFDTILYPPYDEATWEDTWRIIKDMKGLRHLELIIQNNDNFIKNAEAKILAPLYRVDHIPKFNVHVPWEGGPQIKEGPFKVIRDV